MPNLSKYPFKGEESLRTIVAFEMWYSKSYFQPTFLAERPEHLSMKSLFILSLIGEKIGINQRYYLYEILRRVLTALPVISLQGKVWE